MDHPRSDISYRDSLESYTIPVRPNGSEGHVARFWLSRTRAEPVDDRECVCDCDRPAWAFALWTRNCADEVVINGHDLPYGLHWLAWVSLILAILSALLILADIAVGNRQKMAIMNLVWPITALSLGPVAVWLYWCFGRTSRNRGSAREKPFWATTLIGDSHCGAGCTLGDVAGEWLVFMSGLTIAGSVLWADYAIDFLFAYLLGVVFQYFAIAPMRHLYGWPGIIAAIKADTISLAAFEIGMFAWMAFSSKVLFRPRLEPDQMQYWFSMQIAMVIGYATAFPANWWLIRKGLKEAM